MRRHFWQLRGARIYRRPEENRYFVAALNAVEHADATYVEFEGRNHGSIVTQIPQKNDPVAAAIVEFVERLTRL
jgi:hypothetical protein